MTRLDSVTPTPPGGALAAPRPLRQSSPPGAARVSARRRFARLSVCGGFAGLLAAACSSPDPAALRDERFREIVAAARDAAGSPGLSAAVAVGGEIVWSGASGLADVENAVPATADSVYRIASISKPIAATAVMHLAEQGVLDIEAPVREYFPAFPEKEHPVTVRQLMNHTSGIRHYEPGEFDMKEHFDTVEAGTVIFRDDPLLFEPGAEYSYSTYAYNLLAGVVESVSGQSFDDYLQQNIWGPAGMEATYLEHQGDIVPHRVRQYVKSEEPPLVRNAPFADLSIKWAGGGMIATAPDLVRFALALDAETILSTATQGRMTTPTELADGSLSPYGLGWRVEEDEMGLWVAHSGGATGGTTHLLRLPERGLAVALTANVQSGEGLPDAARRLADAALATAAELTTR